MTPFRNQFVKIYTLAYQITKKHYPKFPVHLVICGVLLLLMSGSQTLTPYLLGKIVNALAGQNSSLILSLVFIFVSVWVLEKFLQCASEILNAYISTNCESAVCSDLISKIYSMPNELQNKLNTGEVVSNVDRAMLSFANINHAIFLTLLPTFITILFSFIVVWGMIDFWLASSFLILLTLMMAISIKVAQKSQKIHETLFSAQNSLQSHIISRLMTLFDIKINQAESKETRKLGIELKQYNQQTFKSHANLSLMNFSQTIPVGLFLLVVLLLLAQTSHQKPGDFVTIVTYILQLTAPFSTIAYGFINLKGNFIALELGFEYRNYKNLNAVGHFETAPISTPNVPPLFSWAMLKSNHIDTLFSDGVIREKETTLIIGQSGRGKTTFLNILLGIDASYTGEIKFLGTAPYSEHSQLNQIAFVPQTIHLIKDSLRANLTLGIDAAVDDNELMNLLDSLKLNHILSKSDIQNSFDSIVDPEKKSFSGGEIQRIGIARAILRKKAIMVLDEPTSALDAETEEIVLSLLNKTIPTLIIVSHKNACLRYADQAIEFNSKKYHLDSHI